MKNFKLLLLCCILLSSGTLFAQKSNPVKENIDETLEKWHEAAAEANFDEYFGLIAENGIFIGTDPTENWNKAEFAEFSKPYFDKGKAWSFSSLERNIFIADSGEIAWFDELLDTHMGICRGSGVLVKSGDSWKIKHYVLSIEIPNENVDEISEIKKEFDTKLIKEIRSKEEKE